MGKMLVSLVSDQTIPNVLLIKELPDIDRYLLISTEQMEKQGKSRWIINGTSVDSDRFRTIVVEEDSLFDIEEKLKAIDFQDDDVFFVNLTGGTKIMSVGVYNFFKNKRSEIYYIPIGRNVYRKIFPEVKNRDFPISYRLGAAEYLKSYGVDIASRKPFKTRQDTTNYFDDYISGNTSWQCISLLRPFRSKKKGVAVDEIQDLKAFLNRIRFTTLTDGRLEKKEVEYLTGDWFEEYVYHLVKTELQLGDQDIAAGVDIKRGNVQNEFDVMFTYENALHVIECKTGIYDSMSNRNILTDSIYKMTALRKDFGLTVKSYLFTLSERGEEKTKVKQAYIDRSQMMNVEIIDRAEIRSGCRKFFHKIKSV